MLLLLNKFSNFIFQDMDNNFLDRNEMRYAVLNAEFIIGNCKNKVQWVYTKIF